MCCIAHIAHHMGTHADRKCQQESEELILVGGSEINCAIANYNVRGGWKVAQILRLLKGHER